MKNSLILIVFLMFFSLPLFAETNKVSNVYIQGLQNVKERSVTSVIDLKKGKEYSNDAAREAMRSILELQYFNNVEISFDKDNGNLYIDVEEKPYIAKIVFKGNKHFSTSKLRKESTLKEKDFYDAGKLAETKEKINVLYKDAGYADVEIEAYPSLDDNTNTMIINFLITENNKIVIGGISIEGVFSFKEKKVIKLMKTKPKKVFKEETFQTDLKSIESFYKNNGFMEYQFVDYSVEFNEERTKMFITLNVSEGLKYKIGNISYTGNHEIDSKTMSKLITIKKGEQFNQEKIITSIQNIYEAYSNKGYLQSQIIPDLNKGNEDSVVDVDFVIEENSVVYVGHIYVDGLTSTKEKVIRRELMLKEGDVLAAGKVRRSVEKIYNLGFIDGVDPQILPSNYGDTMDLVFDIMEGKPGMITAGAGYSSVDQFVGSIQFQHMNLFGLGQRLNLLWEFGARRQNYEIDWTEPWIFNKNASLTLSAYNIERKRDYGSYSDAYKESRLGFSAKIGPRISDKVSLLFGYIFENVKIYDIADEAKHSIENATDLSKDRTSSVVGQIAYDTRDYVFDPSRGNRQLFNLQVSGGPLGGNVNFIKGTVKSSWFIPTFWRFVLSFNFTAGMIEPYGGQSTLPLYEKFYVGGADTVRGYKYRTEIGHEDGGKVMGVLNIEYKFPLVSEKGRTILQGAFFYDIGGTWTEPGDINLSLGTGETNLRSGVGFGIRFATPVFPLRLDWGYGLNHKPGEALQQFYFTIGNVF